MRPAAGQPDWYKFDDSKVSRATESDAIDDNFGGDEITEMKIGKDVENTQRFATEKHSSAYMLVYVRRPDIATVFSDSTLPEEEEFLAKMKEEMDRVKREERHLEEMRQYGQIRIYTADESGLCVNPVEAFESGNSGEVNSPRSAYSPRFSKSGPPPLFDARKSRLVSIKKNALLKSLKVEIEKQLGIPVARQRLWSLRDLTTTGLRLDRPLSVEHTNQTVAQYKTTSKPYLYHNSVLDDDDAEFELFVEVYDDIPVENTHVQPHLRDDEDDGASKGVKMDVDSTTGATDKNDGSVPPRADITADSGLTDQTSRPIGTALGESRNGEFDDYSNFEAQAQSAGPNQKGFPSLEDNRLIFVRYFDARSATFSHLGQIYFPYGGSLDILEDAIIPLLVKKEIPQKRDEYLQTLKKDKKSDESNTEAQSGSDAATGAISAATEGQGSQSTGAGATSGVGSENNGSDLDELLFFYSDVHHDMTDALDSNTLRENYSAHGSWVTVQYAPRQGEQVLFRTAKDYILWQKSRITFAFYDMALPNYKDSQPLVLPLTSEMPMHEVWSLLATHLDWPASQIAIAPSHAGNIMPNTSAVIYDGNALISRAFASSLYRAAYSSVPAFYERLAVPLETTKSKTAVKAIFVTNNLSTVPVSLFLQSPSTVNNMIDEALVHPNLKDKFSTSDPELRVFEFDEQRSYYHAKHPTEPVHAYKTYGIEEVSPEELAQAQLKSASCIIYLIHVSASAFYTKPTHLPFVLSVLPNETVYDVKARILVKLGRLESDKETQAEQIANVDCWLRNPSMHSSMPCNDTTLFEDLETEELFVFIKTPLPDANKSQKSPATGDANKNDGNNGNNGSNSPSSQPNTAGAGNGAAGDTGATDTTKTKEKPRNMLHLGD